MPTNRNAFVQWVEDHDSLSWASFFIGVVAVASGPVIGLTSVSGVATLVVGGFLAGGVLVAWIMKPPKFQFRCEACDTFYVLSGVRGATATRKIVTVLKANLDVTAFIYAIHKSSGSTSNSTIRFRNCGRTHDKSKQWYTLGPNQIMRAPTPGGETTVTIHPMAPIGKGEWIELEDELAINGAFAEDEEYVGKTLLYPTKILRFNLEFHDVAINNVLGTVLAPNPVSADAITPEYKDNKSFVLWELHSCRAPLTYRVSWRWPK